MLVALSFNFEVCTMSLNNDSMATSNETLENHDTDHDQSPGNTLAPETDLHQSQVQNIDSLISEIEEINEGSDHAQGENDLTMYDKMTIVQQTFQTVGGDLEDIKTLMFKLREVLKIEDGEDKPDLNKQRRFSGESSNEVSIIEENEEIMQDLPRLQHEDDPTCPTRESSSESLEGRKYSTLIADIEVLKNKLVSLKRNLAE